MYNSLQQAEFNNAYQYNKIRKNYPSLFLISTRLLAVSRLPLQYCYLAIMSPIRYFVMMYLRCICKY